MDQFKISVKVFVCSGNGEKREEHDQTELTKWPRRLGVLSQVKVEVSIKLVLWIHFPFFVVISNLGPII